MSNQAPPLAPAEEEQVFDFDEIKKQEKREREQLKRKALDSGMGKLKRDNHRSSMIEIQSVPNNITVSELADWVKKAGVLKLREDTEEPLIRIVQQGEPLYDDDKDATAAAAAATAATATATGAAAAASSSAAAASAAPQAKDANDPAAAKDNSGGEFKAPSSRAAPSGAPSAASKNNARAFISFLFPESVDQAMLLLDESYIKASGVAVRVLPCKEKESKVFNIQRGKGGQSKKVKRTTVHEQREKALSWKEEKYEKRHVIIQNVFDHSQIPPTDLTYYDELKGELRDEIEAKCGPIETLKVFERSPVGAVAVKFTTWLGADRCIRLMHDRWFDKRRLTCDYYDGKTNYVVQESEAEQRARQEAFGAWLEADEN